MELDWCTSLKAEDGRSMMVCPAHPSPHPGLMPAGPDDDLQILHSRLPPDSTPSATLHLNLPHHPHAHFAPPAYTSASSAIKSKATKPKSAKSVPNGDSYSSGRAAGSQGSELGPVKGTLSKIPENAQAGAGTSAPMGTMVGPPAKSAKAPSMMSKNSRRSKWGNEDAEPLGEVHKREWLEVGSLGISLSETDGDVVPIAPRCANGHRQGWKCCEQYAVLPEVGQS